MFQRNPDLSHLRLGRQVAGPWPKRGARPKQLAKALRLARDVDCRKDSTEGATTHVVIEGALPVQVISRTELVEHLYDQDFDRDSNTIEVFVGRLRKKLGVDMIETVRGLGYRIQAPAK